MNSVCQVAPEVRLVAPDHTEAHYQSFSRRRFLRRLGLTTAGLTCLDFLGYFTAFGLPKADSAAKLASDAAQSNANPHFLIYWYLEGGWMGYDMFNPVVTPNHLLNRLSNISQE